MPHKFPSEGWTLAYKDAVNANEKYRQAGKEWTFGSVAMVIEKNPALGLEADIGMILDVDRGQCRGTKYVHGLDAVQDSPFIIVATYDRWREVLEGGLDPTKAMMQNKLKLVKGHLPTMLRFVESSKQLVASASGVPTEFLT